MMRRALVALLAMTACRSKRDADQRARPVEPVVIKDASAVDAPPSWLQIGETPIVQPVHTVILPSRPDRPRFDVVGPVILGDLAIVGSSQLGFAGIDWRSGTIAWTKPAGSRLAPPAIHDDEVVLIGECANAPEIPDSDALLGCLRTVTATGADEGYIAIHGKAAAVDEFSHAAGDQDLWVEGTTLRWRRGDRAVSIGMISGIATPASITPPPLAVTYGDRHWDIEQVEGALVATNQGKLAWRSDHPYGPLVGAVRPRHQPPMLRTFSIDARSQAPEIRLRDVDVTGSMNSQISVETAPGIAVLAHDISPVGDVALAVRFDKTLKHDYVAGFAANALLVWAYPLPQTTRVDPIGVAIALEPDRGPAAVVVFYDGDTVAILPELSSPPTAPGAIRRPSENATP